MRLILDDKRIPLPAKDTVVVRSVEEFKDFILKNPLPEYISFDHNLTSEHDELPDGYWGDGISRIRYKDTGFHAAVWFMEYFEKNHKDCTQYPRINIHAQGQMGPHSLRHVLTKLFYVDMSPMI